MNYENNLLVRYFYLCSEPSNCTNVNKHATFIQKCNICIMIIDNTIFHQINMSFKQKSLMSKKYLHSCSSFTNANIFSGKHIIEYFMHYSDRIYQFTFLLINVTKQRCNPRQKSTFAQFSKILPKCK